MNMHFELNKIYNEDCYKAIKEMPDKSVDCIYTDIPYLYNQGGCGKSELGQRTAKMRAELIGATELYEQAKKGGDIRSESLRIAKNCKEAYSQIVDLENGIDYTILDEFVRVLKKINCFIWCSKLQILDILKFFVEKHGCLFEILTWCKTNPLPTCSNKWLPDIEYCLYFRESGVKLNDGTALKKKWYISPLNTQDKEKFAHPTIKPLKLVEQHLLHATQPNDIILDPFIGSGTTAVAAKNIGRYYIGFEINPNYYNIAVKRLNNEQADGQMSMITF